tara:strand:- start:266 stop:448 length:183 start_codon:yes stop_codon:yes gene_type:complete
MKYKEDVEKAVEKAEQLALTLQTITSTPRLNDSKEVTRITEALRTHLKFIADRVSLERNG